MELLSVVYTITRFSLGFANTGWRPSQVLALKSFIVGLALSLYMPYAFACVGDFPFPCFKVIYSRPCPKPLLALSLYMPYAFTCVGDFPFLAFRLFKVGLPKHLIRQHRLAPRSSPCFKVIYSRPCPKLWHALSSGLP